MGLSVAFTGRYGSTSDKVMVLSIVAALMVVAIHVGGNVATHGSLVWWWGQIGHYGVFLTAVPFFFICSGFFLGRHCNEDWWVKYVFALAGSVLVCWVMKRFFPRIASVAFGGR